MPDPEIHIIDASRAGPLDWPLVAEKFYQAQQRGVGAIQLDIPKEQKLEDIHHFIHTYCEARRIGMSAEELSNPIKALDQLLQTARGFAKVERARPGAPSRGVTGDSETIIDCS